MNSLVTDSTLMDMTDQAYKDVLEGVSLTVLCEVFVEEHIVKSTYKRQHIIPDPAEVPSSRTSKTAHTNMFTTFLFIAIEYKHIIRSIFFSVFVHHWIQHACNRFDKTHLESLHGQYYNYCSSCGFTLSKANRPLNTVSFTAFEMRWRPACTSVKDPLL